MSKNTSCMLRNMTRLAYLRLRLGQGSRAKLVRTGTADVMEEQWV